MQYLLRVINTGREFNKTKLQGKQDIDIGVNEETEMKMISSALYDDVKVSLIYGGWCKRIKGLYDVCHMK